MFTSLLCSFAFRIVRSSLVYLLLVPCLCVATDKTKIILPKRAKPPSAGLHDLTFARRTSRRAYDVVLVMLHQVPP